MVITILAAFNDCYDGAVEIMTNSEKYKIDTNRVIVTGDSAGGQLSLSVGMFLRKNGYPIKGTVPVYPVTQIVTGTTKSYFQENYAITQEGVAWAASMYIYGNLKVLNPYQNGQLYNVALAHDKKLVSNRLRYSNENYKFSNSSELFDLDHHGLETIFDPRVSPLMASDEMLKNMPPTHIYASEHDVLRDQGCHPLLRL